MAYTMREIKKRWAEQRGYKDVQCKELPYLLHSVWITEGASLVSALSSYKERKGCRISCGAEDIHF